MTLTITVIFVTLSTVALSITSLSTEFGFVERLIIYIYSECHYADCRYGQCCYTEGRGAHLKCLLESTLVPSYLSLPSVSVVSTSAIGK